MQEKRINKKTILIVEDENPIIKILKDELQANKFNVLMAKNGKEGLRISIKEHPDLILLDIVMPIMDGITMLKRLRKDKWGETVKIILLTNLNSAEKIEESIEQNVHDYLIKTNWEIGELIKKIKTKL